jgi:hypothetical protein
VIYYFKTWSKYRKPANRNTSPRKSRLWQKKQRTGATIYSKPTTSLEPSLATLNLYVGILTSNLHQSS